MSSYIYRMLSNHMNTIPDLFDPIEGWRGWKVVDGTFHSPQRKGEWVGGKLSWDGQCRCGAKANKRIVSASSKVLGFAARLAGGPAPLVADKQPPAPSLGELVGVASNTLGGLAQKAGDQCHCGINAFGTEHQIQMSNYFNSCQAIGVVHLSGEVRQFAKGWRAQHAQVARVWATQPEYEEIVREAAKSVGAVYEGVAEVDEGERAAARAAEAKKALKMFGTVFAAQAALLVGAEVIRHHSYKSDEDKAAETE